MKWAFWRRRKSKNSGARRADPRAESEADKSAGDPAAVAEQAEQLRARARRRLIGAAVLLLGAAVFVPMFLDPAPRPLPDNIPIDIPSDRTPFAPRLSLPAETGADTAAREAADRKAEVAAQDVQDSSVAAPAAKDGKAADGAGQSTAPKSEAGHWVVQAAALSSQGAAQKLSERLVRVGLTPFVERVSGSDGTLYRVRLGPYSSKEGALKMKRRLEGLGVESTVVRAEASGR
jgi:DedD protein